MVEALQLYCHASGQRIHLDKCYVFFSKGFSNDLRQEVKNALNVQVEALSDRYLGMPTEIGRSKNGGSKYLKDTCPTSICYGIF